MTSVGNIPMFLFRCKHPAVYSMTDILSLTIKTADEQIYHCGASSKDGGNKVTTITAVTDGEIYHPVIGQLLNNPVLVLR